MNSKTMMKLAASTLLLGTAMVSTQSLAEASASKAIAAAEQANYGAERALAARQGDRAVRFAEAAVAAAPNEARYRATLGQAYLLVGRFSSAETTFSDALALDPSNGRAALSLALSQTALGRNGDALATLDAIRVPVAAEDLGLARALAGDTNGAIEVLSAAAREPGAGAKTRQNLALSFALAGKWREARTVAAQDVSPAEIDQRIGEWAKFTQPKGSWDQVAALLGVTPAADPGQPVALALAQPDNQAATKVAVAAPVIVAPVVKAPVVVASAPVLVPPVVATARTAPAPLPVPSYRAAPTPAVSAALIRRPATPVKTALAVAPAAPERTAVKAPKASAAVRQVMARSATGKFVVQLGAFSNVANVERAWSSARAKLRQLGAYTPSRGSLSTASASLHRLSVGGFATRAQAVRLCDAIRTSGGSCFVRSTAGDAPVQWVSRDKPIRLASR